MYMKPEITKTMDIPSRKPLVKSERFSPKKFVKERVNCPKPKKPIMSIFIFFLIFITTLMCLKKIHFDHSTHE